MVQKNLLPPSQAAQATVPVDNVAQAYLELLAHRGIKYFFGNDGTDFARLVDAFARFAAEGRKFPKPVLVPHEMAAVSMAHGFAMVKGPRLRHGGGDFELRAGSAYTSNLLLEGPAVDIGVVGRTGLVAQDYDQTVAVSGNPSGPITVAGALAAGPVGAAGALLFSQLFKGQLQGLARVYYRVTGPWANPKVERISAAADGAATGPAAGQKEKR